MRLPFLGANVLYCSADGAHHSARIIKVQDGFVVSLVVFPASRTSTQFQSRENVPYCTEEGVEGWKWNEAVEQSAGYTYTQENPAALWSIPHGLGKQYPNVRSFNEQGQKVYGDEVYIDINQMSIEFSRPISGFALLE